MGIFYNLFNSFKRNVFGRNKLTVLFEVTDRCNINCRKCSCRHWPDGSGTKKELSLEEIEKLAKILLKLRVGEIRLTGGEPLLRNDIEEVIRIFIRKGFSVVLFTNGLLLSEERARLLIKTGLRKVSISLDSLDKDNVAYLAQQDGVRDRIIKAIYLFSKYLPAWYSFLNINTVLSKPNLKEIPALAKFANTIGCSFSFLPIDLPKICPDLSITAEYFSEADEVHKKLTVIKKRGFNMRNSYAFLKKSLYFIKYGKSQFKCSPLQFITIKPNGIFFQCHNARVNMSIFDEGFIERFNSKEVRESLLQQIENCPGCACYLELILRYRDGFSVFLTDALIALNTALVRKIKLYDYNELIQLAEAIRIEDNNILKIK